MGLIRFKNISIGTVFSVLLLTSCGLQQEPAQTIREKFWQGKERTLRYQPQGEFFVGKNGDQRFTRAIYGTNTGFRFETSDYPEFGLYMPNLGGSMYLGIITPHDTVWIKEIADIESKFRSGERTYTLTDFEKLGKGQLIITAVAMADADGMIIKCEGEELPDSTQLVWVYGGASNQRFSREGDLGADPKDCFYITPEKCTDNTFLLKENGFKLYYGMGSKELSLEDAYENPENLTHKAKVINTAQAKSIEGNFSENTTLKIADACFIDSLSKLLNANSSKQNVVIALQPANGVNMVQLLNPQSRTAENNISLVDEFEKGVERRSFIAGRVKIDTPDPYINTLGGIFSGAEDAVWESPGYLHGAIGWRMPLTGWRAAYLADLMGMHERARTHFNGYAASQITDKPVTKPAMQDPAANLSRSLKEWGTPMYSNGYICRSPHRTNVMHHYDMNLVFIDELLWHLNWTGDKNYAKEIFPVIQRHLAWEKQLFDPDNDFMYDGYCCIWASDALQYNGGESTHATAYNYRANRMAAMIASLIGDDPAPYQQEADGIINAINQNLWLPEKGWWAEFKDNMGHQKVHEDAAVWSIYHAIDSDIHDCFKAYQATKYIDTQIPHIPVVAYGYKETDNYVVATTDWQPYIWSINNVAFAEIMHTALAFYQAGRGEEAFKMFKGSILDAMYMGSGPGNITQISFYDAARGETYRDFADPVAIGLRTMVQGMYGIIPDLLNGKLTIKPAFPKDWNHASIETQNMNYRFERKGKIETYMIKPGLPTQASLSLELQTPYDKIKYVRVNGKPVDFTLLEESVGQPMIRIEAGQLEQYDIEIAWDGKKWENKDTYIPLAQGQEEYIPSHSAPIDVYDPQNVFENYRITDQGIQGMVRAEKGYHTFFIKQNKGDLTWWKPVDVYVVPAIEIVNNTQEGNKSIDFQLKNHTNQSQRGKLVLNGKVIESVDLKGHETKTFVCDVTEGNVFGTNIVEWKSDEKNYSTSIVNWNVPAQEEVQYENVDLSTYFNDEINNIYAYGKYLSPRWEYTTLCVPTQGMGQWCHPTELSLVDDSGLRQAATENIYTVAGIPFATPQEEGAKNIVFTTLWDNYPNQITIPLEGKASHIYFLLAASTYHMQAHFLNGILRINYTDGSYDTLDLILPQTLLPLDQSIFIDNHAFRCELPRPYRVELMTGKVNRFLDQKMKNGPIYIKGGLATMNDLPLDKNKELASLTLETTANEVIIGLMGATLVRE